MINKQIHSTTCGPIAIANAAQSKGIPISYRTAIDLCAGLGDFEFKKGMSVDSILEVLKELGIVAGLYKKAEVLLLEELLRLGKHLILIHECPVSSELHASFIDYETNDYLRVYNSYMRAGSLYVDKDELEALLKTTEDSFLIHL